MKDELNEILDKYDEALAQEKKAQDDKESEFMQAFEGYLKIKKTVIRPALEGVTVILEKHHHGYNIVDRENTPSLTEDYRKGPFIGLEFFPFPYMRREFDETSTPSIRFSPRLLSGVIVVYVCTNTPKEGGSSVREKKEFPINEITQDDIRQEVFSFIKKIFAILKKDRID